MLFNQTTRALQGQDIRLGSHPSMSCWSNGLCRLCHADESLFPAPSRVMRVAGHNSNHQPRRQVMNSTRPRLSTWTTSITSSSSGGFRGCSQAIDLGWLMALVRYFPLRSGNARRWRARPKHLRIRKRYEKHEIDVCTTRVIEVACPFEDPRLYWSYYLIHVPSLTTLLVRTHLLQDMECGLILVDALGYFRHKSKVSA
jgi:hypothetical protein